MIKRFIKIGVWLQCLAWIFVISGCTSVTVSQDQVNQEIAQELAKSEVLFEFPVALSQSGDLVFDAKGQLASATVMLEAANADEPEGFADIFLILNGRVVVALLGQRLGFEVDALPHIRSQLEVREQALYLKEPRLMDLDLKMPSSGLISPVVTPGLKAEVSKLIAEHFKDTPILYFNELDHPLSGAVSSVEIIDQALVLKM